MSAPQQALLTSIRDPDVEGGRLLTTVLQKNCIPCVYGLSVPPYTMEVAFVLWSVELKASNMQNSAGPNRILANIR